jgi:iron(III) transport system permease protein
VNTLWPTRCAGCCRPRYLRVTLATAAGFVGAGLPLLALLVELGREGAAWTLPYDWPRIVRLAEQTLRLVGLTLALCAPLGLGAAVLLYHSDLPGAGLWRRLLIAALFVPLPLLASAWQAVLGSGGLLPSANWQAVPPDDPDVARTGLAWKPWPRGLGAAATIHAIWGLPWVIWLTGLALQRLPPELEEQALTVAGPLRVLRLVSLPRVGPVFIASLAWVALHTATEIVVTDMLLVRTFAEEVYTQFAAPEPGVASERAALARSTFLAGPQVLVSLLAVIGCMRLWQRLGTPTHSVRGHRPLVRLGRLRWPVGLAVAAVVGAAVAVPVAGLIWKAGLAGSPERFTLTQVGVELVKAVRIAGWVALSSVAVAALAAWALAHWLRWVGWLALDARWLRGGLVIVAAVVWALPGPVLGYAVKLAIGWLLDAETWLLATLGVGGPGPLEVVLYLGPSPVPLLWAAGLRYAPLGWLILWAGLRTIAPEARELVRVESERPADEYRWVIAPATRPATRQASLVLTVLILGELSASKCVETPGYMTLTHEIFNQMHYGVMSQVACLCLMQLGLIVGLVGLMMVVSGQRFRQPPLA